MGYSIKRVDSNQMELVRIWRSLGASVAITSMLGNGFPDVVVGITTIKGNKVNILVEIKDGEKPLSKQKLTEDEIKFHELWKGHICIIRSAAEAIELYNTVRKVA